MGFVDASHLARDIERFEPAPNTSDDARKSSMLEGKAEGRAKESHADNGHGVE